jgi:peptidoglycan/xylan/chitin deacetylase (PgdA/CDA1 family)
MRRQGVIGTRRRFLPARLLLGLAALAFSTAACGPERPALVTALPSLTLTAVPPVSTRTATLQPASPTQAPSATERPTAIATPSIAPSDSPTSPPSDAGTATQIVLPSPSATSANARGTPPTPDAQASTRRVRLPILLYHYVEPWPANASTLRQALTVQPADFAAQMAYLHEQGYLTVSLYDLMAAITLGQPLPNRAVVLTFDDGYRTLMDFAAPAMKLYGYTGTVFVITQLMDENFTQYLTWSQAESLYAAGWKIEPHTKTHPRLAGRDRAYQLYEMLGSVQTVQAHIGTAPRFFAYPFGAWDALTIKLAKEMNLWAAVTELPGAVHDYADRYTLHRVRINGTITLPGFIRTLQATQ